ncbi:hypothetical protein [Calothrix rhizosoleniae]|uniref:hypothetical protein n=1 Tax=Calothrix rhizosoleniae TaxID=888997 RepID=UPI000B4A17FD|nr:hypothetical protein [Calothrix rhizosoleniae]
MNRKVKVDNPFVGTWHIYDMDMWDEDYFNMETQAYVEIRADNMGDFQFGLVTGSLGGYMEKIGDIERFSFTWEGNDEMDEANGSGWLQLISENEISGMINFHLGDCSTFQARKPSE